MSFISTLSTTALSLLAVASLQTATAQSYDVASAAGKQAIHNSTYDTAPVIEKRTFLGVVVSADEHSGMKVEQVVAGSPADQAGLKQGDVLLQIGTFPTGNMAALTRALRNLPVGKAVEVKALRNETPITLQLTATEKDYEVKKWGTATATKEISAEENLKNFTDPTVGKRIAHDIERPSLHLLTLQCFPNTTTDGKFALSFDNTDKKQPMIVRIFDQTGKIVYAEMVAPETSHYDKMIDLGNAPIGNYFLQIAQGDKSLARNLRVE